MAKKEYEDHYIAQIIYPAFVTVHEMMEDRGYAIDEENKSIDLEDFRERYFVNGEMMKALGWLEFERNGEKAVVSFNDETGLEKTKIKDLLTNLGMNGISRSIIIVQEAQMSRTKNFRQDQGEGASIDVEIFDIMELTFNPTKHELVPRHQIMSPEETKALCAKYKCDLGKFPIILSSDRISRYLGAKQNQVLAIYRKNAVYYRRVL